MIVVTIRAFENTALARILVHLLANRMKHNHERSRESKYLPIVYPTNLTTAISMLFVRPWDDWEQQDWDRNGFVSPTFLGNSGEPSATAAGAKKNAPSSSWAKLP
jgi:hypothetical protein